MASEKGFQAKGPVAGIDDGDAALQFLAVGETIEMTPEDERRLVWKIDMRIVPLMCRLPDPGKSNVDDRTDGTAVGCYFLQYLDKTLSPYHIPVRYGRQGHTLTRT